MNGPRDTLTNAPSPIGEIQGDASRSVEVPLRRRLWFMLKVCRPHEWAKNIFVLAPLIFSRSFLYFDASLAAVVALVCFCLWSSAVYIFNDLIDIEADRKHPRKCRRPLPSGQISKVTVAVLAAILVLTATGLAWFRLPREFLILGGMYLGNSLVYCLFLKHRVLWDVILIAVGFVLRLLAGCAAIGVEPSSWVVVCGFSLALMLGFGKRRTEMVNLTRPEDYRPALHNYSSAKLDTLLAITCSICLLSYILYTIAPETVAIHGTNRLMYTVPFVAYGLFRFMFKVQEGKGDGPVEVLTRDKVFALNGFMWIAAVAAVLVFK